MEKLCDACKTRPAVFECAGDSETMPAHLKHEPHASCWECDLGCGCMMVAGTLIRPEKKD